MVAVVSRALWLIVASVAAYVGVGWALWAFHSGAEHVLSVFALLRYAGVVVVLGAVAYGVHRLAFRAPPATAATNAARDAVLAGVLAGPFLYAAIDIAYSIRECSFGAGC